MIDTGAQATLIDNTLGHGAEIRKESSSNFGELAVGGVYGALMMIPGVDPAPYTLEVGAMSVVTEQKKIALARARCSLSDDLLTRSDETSGWKSKVCNLYSIITNQAAMIAPFRGMNGYVGNLPSMPGVFPDYPAPVVRNMEAGREPSCVGACPLHRAPAVFQSPTSATPVLIPTRITASFCRLRARHQLMCP